MSPSGNVGVGKQYAGTPPIADHRAPAPRTFFEEQMRKFYRDESRDRLF